MSLKKHKVYWKTGFELTNTSFTWCWYVSITLLTKCNLYWPIYNNNNHGSTALYGLRPHLSEVTRSCAFVAVGDWSTGRAAVLSILMSPPEPSGRQSGDLGEKLPQFGLRNISIHARKVILHAVNLRHGTDGFTSPPKWCSGFLSSLKIHRPRSGSNPRTLTTSPPRST
jgi:hypothetical protein